MVLGVKGWTICPRTNWPSKEHTHHRNMFWVHWSKIHASQGKLWLRWRNPKMKKVKKDARVKLHHMSTSPPFATATVFCMWCRTVDLIKRAKFHVNGFGDLGDPGAKLILRWFGASHFTTVYALMCYTVNVMCVLTTTPWSYRSRRR